MSVFSPLQNCIVMCIAYTGTQLENENMNNSGDSEAVDVCADSPTNADSQLIDDKRRCQTVSTVGFDTFTMSYVCSFLRHI